MNTLWHDKLREHQKCKECGGAGGGNADYVNADHHTERGAGDWENCENCKGSGLEPDDDIVKERILDDLTKEMEAKLMEEHAKQYLGLDDDMPDAFEHWLCNLNLTSLITILK